MKQYTIGEVAERLGVSVHTLRFYAREGLFDFAERDENGVRLFKDEDFEKMFIIASLKRAGMSIKDIRRFIALTHEGDSSIPERLEIIQAQRDKTEEQITELNDALDVLKYKEWLYSTPNHDDMPPKIRRIKERIRRLTDDMESRYKVQEDPDGGAESS